MYKKSISIVLALLMLVSVFVIMPTTASAKMDSDSGVTGSCKWVYDSKTKTLTISGNGIMDDYALNSKFGAVPPWKPEGKFEKGDIVSIVVENGVTSIGENAFYNCYAVELKLPNSLKSIGYGAFSNNNFSSVTLPNKLETIGAYAFDSCTYLQSVNFPNGLKTIGNSAFMSTKISEIKTPSSVTSIGAYAFAQNKDVKKIEIHGTDCTIGNNAFNECGGTEVDYVKLDGVKTIGEDAFYDVYEKELSLGNVVTIGKGAFDNNEMLTKVTVPESCTKIEDKAFYSCTGLKDITILNPDCVIYDSADTIYYHSTLKYTVIHGMLDSTAEKYAKKYNREFVSLNKVLDTNILISITAPKDGEKPDYSIEYPGSAEYKPEDYTDAAYGWNNGVIWYDESGKNLNADSVFKAGKKYKFRVSLVPRDSINMFTDDTSKIKAYVNNENAVASYFTYDKRTKNIYVQYTFTCKENPSVQPETSEQAGSSEQSANPSSSEASSSEADHTKTDISDWDVAGLENVIYTGSAIRQDIDVVSSSLEYADFTAKYYNNKNAGTAYVTITGTGNYTGTIVTSFEIFKAANPVKVTAKKTVSAKAAKKTTIKKAVTVKNAKGAVTYKTNNKKITVKKGAMIVAKGLKKGKTYKVKVTVKAKGDSNYHSKSKTVTVKVKVK